MSGFSRVVEIYQFFWMLRSNHHQVLAWQDAAEARVAREKAERQAAAQLKAMLDANPSGQLGNSKLDDASALKQSGLV